MVENNEGIFREHYQFDSCKSTDLGTPLGALKLIGYLISANEIPSNLIQYGLWGARYPFIAKSSSKNI